jgi:hypothetical protein
MVLSADEGGGFLLENLNAGKVRSYKSMKDFQYNAIIQLMGPAAASSMVGRTQAIADERQLPNMGEFQNRVAGALYEHQERARTVVGDGIWQIQKEDSYQTVLVHNRRFFVLDGLDLVRYAEPVMDDYVIDHKAATEWCDIERLKAELLKAGDVEYRRAALKRLKEFLLKWTWRDKWMLEVASGLFCATWLQSIWQWRPIAILNGETSSGKSQLLEDCFGVMWPGSDVMANYSEASIRQAIRTSSRPMGCDEFDRIKQDKKVHDLLRGAGRGQETTRGTSSHNVQRFRLNHIVWLSGISESIHQIADKNRRVTLELLANKKEIKEGTLAVPRHELEEVGYALLASTIAVADRAKEIEQRMVNSGRMELGLKRYHENYVPVAATLEALTEHSMTKKAMIWAQHEHDSGLSVGYDNDYDEVLATIFRAQVRCPDGSTTTAGALIFNHGGSIATDLLEPLGITMMCRQTRIGFEIETLVTSGALKGTDFEGNRGIRKLMLRAPKERLECRPSTAKIGGIKQNVVTFDLQQLIDHYENAQTQTTLF